MAILAPVAWRTPPRQYGAWETVAGNITEGLVARGWDVTLFATADSITTARLCAVVNAGYEEDREIDPKVAEYLHISTVFERAAEFDLIHSHYDFMALTYTKLVSTPVLTTIHGFSSPKIMPVYRKYREGYFVSISDSDRAAGLSCGLNYLATVYNGIDLSLYPLQPAGGEDLISWGGFIPIKACIWRSKSRAGPGCDSSSQGSFRIAHISANRLSRISTTGFVIWVLSTCGARTNYSRAPGRFCTSTRFRSGSAWSSSKRMPRGYPSSPWISARAAR